MKHILKTLSEKRAYTKLWFINNPDKRRVANARYYAKNRKRILRDAAEQRRICPEIQAAHNKAWRERNPNYRRKLQVELSRVSA